jgi:hypothetical protein
MQLGWRDDRSTPTHGASTGPSAIERLPNEVLIDIFSYLDAAALAHVAATCSLIRQVALHDGLWKPFVARAIHTLSPPVRGPAIHPLESTLPLWHPDYGMQADTIHPPSWPIAAEFVRQPAGANGTGDTDDQAQLDLSLFKGAASLHEVYVRFIRPTESLLGWWASDLPSYGMVVRVVLDMHFTFTDYHAVGHRAAAARSEAIQIDAESPRGPPRRQSPSIVCQRIYPTNRLQGLDSDMARWSDVVGFPMPSSSAVIGQGTILRRSLTQIRTDLCEPGIRTEDLWHYSWNDARLGLAPPTTPASTQSQASAEKSDADVCDVRAHISSESWLRSVDPRGASRALHRARLGGQLHDSDDELLFEDEAEEIDRVMQHAAGDDALFRFAFERQEDYDPARITLRRRLVGPIERTVVGGMDYRSYRLSDAVATRSADSNEGRVRVRLTPCQPYWDVQMRNAVFLAANSRPPPPVSFPPPALLPAIRAVEWSTLANVQIGMSGIWERMDPQRRWLIQGERLAIDSITMAPPPPYRPGPTDDYACDELPRFFPIQSPHRISGLTPPALRQPTVEPEVAVPASLSSFGPDPARVPASTPDGAEYDHVAPSPSQDPAHAEFDWSLMEGLYSMTYGPHGVELLYIRARTLGAHDFEHDPALPEWPSEPLLSSDDMYEQTRISRAAARPGARVLEAVKVLGDPNIPRGQITWRAFIDDPGRSAVPWRPPPKGFRKHTPWPLRPPLGAEERSPGLVLPAHGRVAGEGFVGPGWATALACVSSVDEIQIWWQPMYKISVANRLVAM